MVWKVSARCDNINKIPYPRAILIDMSGWQVANALSTLPARKIISPVISFDYLRRRATLPQIFHSRLNRLKIFSYRAERGQIKCLNRPAVTRASAFEEKLRQNNVPFCCPTISAVLKLGGAARPARVRATNWFHVSTNVSLHVTR